MSRKDKVRNPVKFAVAGMTAVLFGAMCASNAEAKVFVLPASSVCFGGDLDPSHCASEQETPVVLKNAFGVLSGVGYAGKGPGATEVDFSSTSKMDFKSDAIFPHRGSGGEHEDEGNSDNSGGNLHVIDVKTPKSTFKDLEFEISLLGEDDVRGDLTIKAFNGATLEGSHTYTHLHDGEDLNFIVQATSGLFTNVEIFSSAPIKEVSEFEISGIERPIPEASTWAMMLIGFLGLGLAGSIARRRQGNARTICA